MLSPGVYHKQIPTDERANLFFRLALLKVAARSVKARQLLLDACREDAPFFVGVFGWQYNPDDVGREIGPFIPYPFQVEALLQTIHRLYTLRKDVVWEKSRKMGASWLAQFKDDWLCLFHTRKKTLAVSHTEAAVDKSEDSDSLFWKTALIHEHLPDWMSRGVRKKKLRFYHPITKSAQTGATSTGRTGVSGRASSVFSDETALQENAAAIISRTRDTGPRLFASSHHGATEFSRMCQRPDIFKIQFHWTQRPRFSAGLYRSNPESALGYEVLDQSYEFPPDYPFVTTGRPFGGPYPGLRSPWYDTECVERGSARDVAMHLDIDVSGSGWQFYDPGTITGLERELGRAPLWEGDIEVTPQGEAVKLERLAGGPLKLWLHPSGDLEFPEGRYGGGSDLSEGTGATPSVFSMGNATIGAKVLEYAHAHLSPEKFALIVAALGRLFRDSYNRPALITWENAGSVGASFAKSFFETGYRRVHYQDGTMGQDGHFEPTTKAGWSPIHKASRSLLHREYRAALASRRFVNPSVLALRQTLEFEYVGGDDVRHPGEASGDDPTTGRENHGDYVIADALCCRVLMALKVRRAEPEEVERLVTVLSLAGRRAEAESQDRESAWS